MNDMTEDLYTSLRQFEDAEEATQEAREKAERDRDYYDEKQWTSNEKAELEKRGQPAITYNRIKRKVNAMLGLEKQTRKDPKAFPRNPSDDGAATAATDALRYVCDDTRWDDKRSQGARDLAIEGTMAVMVGVKRGPKGVIDPDIRRIAWDRLYYDPHSVAFDFEDASFLGVVVWMDYADAVRKWPEARDVLDTTLNTAQNSDTYDDTPKYRLWADYRRKRVRICEHYYKRDGVWHFCMMTKGGFLIEPQPSPYLDSDGEPECPIKAVSLYVDRDGNRYGEVRTMIGPQDEINKRRSKALHLISQRQVRVSATTGLDPAAIRKELSRPDGVLVGEPGDIEILPTNDMASANLQLLQEAKAEIDLLGPNAALGGKNEQSMSGRAILAQQQGSVTELATYLDCIKTVSIAVYRSIWARIKQHWQEERWIRVTDDERNIRFIGLNSPVTAIQEEAERLGIQKGNLEQAPPEALQYLQSLAMNPAAQQVVRVDNAIAELDVDIIIDEGIDSPTIAAEQFDQMLKLAGNGLQIPPDVLIEASALRNKDKLLERMQQGPSPEQQAMQQAAMQLQMAGEEAQVEKTKSETAKNLATAQQTQAETMMAGVQMGMQTGAAL